MKKKRKHANFTIKTLSSKLFVDLKVIIIPPVKNAATAFLKGNETFHKTP